MSANSNIAGIARGIQEALDGGDGTCATFTVQGDADRWVQFTGGLVNAAYPRAQDPAPLLAQLGGATVESCEPGQHLTVRLAPGDAEAIARWIDGYFQAVLVPGGAFAVECSVEEL